MQRRIRAALQSKLMWLITRIALAIVFLGSGIGKLADFQGGVAEMAGVGLSPAWAFNVAVVVTLLGSSALLLFDRAVWLAAVALGAFLLLTILIVHRFWALPDPQAKFAFFTAVEHISLIGGLFAAAIASVARKSAMRA